MPQTFAQRLQAAIDSKLLPIVEGEGEEGKKPEEQPEKRADDDNEPVEVRGDSERYTEKPRRAYRGEEDEERADPRQSLVRPKFDDDEGKKPGRSYYADEEQRFAKKVGVPGYAKDMGFYEPPAGRTNEDLIRTRFPMDAEKIRGDVPKELSKSQFLAKMDEFPGPEDGLKPWDIGEILNALWPNIYHRARQYSKGNWTKTGKDENINDLEEVVQNVRLELIKNLDPRSPSRQEDAGGNFISWIVPMIESAASVGVGATRSDGAAKGFLGALVKATKQVAIQKLINSYQEDGGAGYGEHGPMLINFAEKLLPVIEQKPEEDDDGNINDPCGDIKYQIKQAWEDLGGGRDNRVSIQGPRTGMYDTISTTHSERDGSRLIRKLIAAKSPDEAYDALRHVLTLKPRNGERPDRPMTNDEIFKFLGDGNFKGYKALSQKVAVSSSDDGESKESIEAGVLSKRLLDAYKSADPERDVEMVKQQMKDWIQASGDRDAFRQAHGKEGMTVPGAGGEEIDNPGLSGVTDSTEERTLQKEALKRILTTAYLGNKKVNDEEYKDPKTGEVKKRKRTDYELEKKDDGYDIQLSTSQLRVIIRLFGLNDYPLRGETEPIMSRQKSGGAKGEMEHYTDPEYDDKQYKHAFALLQETAVQFDDADDAVSKTAIDKVGQEVGQNDLKSHAEALPHRQKDYVPAHKKRNLGVEESYERAFGQHRPITESVGVPTTTKCAPNTITTYDVDGMPVKVYGFKAVNKQEAYWAIELVTSSAGADAESYEEALAARREEAEDLVAVLGKALIVRVISDGEEMSDVVAHRTAYSMWVRKGCPAMRQFEIAADLGIGQNTDDKGKSRIKELMGNAIGSGDINSIATNPDSVLARIGQRLKQELGLDDYEDRIPLIAADKATMDIAKAKAKIEKMKGGKGDVGEVELPSAAGWRNYEAAKQFGWKRPDNWKDPKAKKKPDAKKPAAKKPAKKDSKNEEYHAFAKLVNESMVKLITICNKLKRNAAISESIDDVDYSIIAGVARYVEDKYLRMYR